MNKRWLELCNFLQERKNTYINSNGVLFNQVTPGFLLVDAPWPGYKGPADLCLAFLCFSGKSFFKNLGIKDPAQLDEVRAEMLLPLVKTGDAMVVCSYTGLRSLEFSRNMENQLVAVCGDTQLEHEVAIELKTPEDFVGYTKAYFEKAKKMKQLN